MTKKAVTNVPADRANDVSMLIAQWETFKATLGLATAREREARSLVVSNAFDDLGEGTNRAVLDPTCQVVVKQPYNYKLDETALQATFERLDPGGVYGLAAKLLRWKPELVLDEYRQLTDAQKLILAEALSITPGTPQLEIERKVPTGQQPATAPAGRPDWLTRGVTPPISDARADARIAQEVSPPLNPMDAREVIDVTNFGVSHITTPPVRLDKPLRKPAAKKPAAKKPAAKKSAAKAPAKKTAAKRKGR